VTREGWGEGAGLRSSYRQASSNPRRRIEWTVQISSRTSRRCRYCARKALLFCSCTRTERRKLSPAESPLFLRSPTSLAGLSFLVAIPRRSLRSSRQVYSFFRVSSSCSSSLTSFSFRLGSLFHFLPASGSFVSPSTERSVVAVTLLLYMFR
jgi:hypothetical protein